MSAILDGDALQAAFAQPNPDGTFNDDVLAYLRDIGSRRSILLLAFAPKAAGTFFRQAAIHAIDGDLFRLSHAQGGRDATPYLPNLIALYLDDELPEIVVHAHMQAFTANRHFLLALGIRPVIMLRNIPDMLASFWDMLEVDAVARAEGLNCQVPSNFVEFSRAKKADFIVDEIAPWYVSYFATWKTFSDEMPNQVCVLRYGDFCEKPSKALHMALSHAGFFVSQSNCEAAISRVWSKRSLFRYNRGTEGRGRDYFSARHFTELSRKLSHYPQLNSWESDLMHSGIESCDVQLIRHAAL